MRTAGQGQAAVPRERVRRRRLDGRLGRRIWAVGEYLTDCHDSGALSRLPLAMPGMSGFAVGRVLRTAVLFCANPGNFLGGKSI